MLAGWRREWPETYSVQWGPHHTHIWIGMCDQEGNSYVLALSAGKGVVPLAEGIETSWSFCQAQSCHNDAVARPEDSDGGHQSRRKHLGRKGQAVSTGAAAASWASLSSWHKGSQGAQGGNLPSTSCHSSHGRSSHSSHLLPAQ